MSQEPLREKKRIKTVLRTFRIPQNLNDILESEAGSRGISPNALVSSIITKFANWDRFAERFGCICVTQELFKTIFEHVPDEELAVIAENNAVRITKEALMFWYKQSTADAFLTYLDSRCKYAGFGEFEYQKRQGGQCVFALHHRLGEKWSAFLKQYFDKTMRIIGITTARFEASEDEIIGNLTI